MKGTISWSFAKYTPPLFDGEQLYINRLAPYENRIELGWDSRTPATVRYKKRSDSVYAEVPACDGKAVIEGLDEGYDYELYVSSGELNSRVRLARTGKVPGTIVNYLHPEDKIYDFSGKYLCSPSLLCHPDGYMLASMDVFEGGAPQNLTLIFRSDDAGESWYHLCELFPCFWGKLFLHHREIYMLGMSTEYGDILIGKSTDGGRSFGVPTVIARGSCSNRRPGWHKAPMPVVEQSGRLWTAVDWGAWSCGGHASALLSADAGSELLDASNWSITSPTPYEACWAGTVEGQSAGCLEGNAVVSPDGEVYNMLRYQTNGCVPSWGKALILKADTEKPDSPLVFEKVVDFPGNLSKFDILYDKLSRRYYSITSNIRDGMDIGSRTLLSLCASEDLESWSVLCDLIDYTRENPHEVGFQYISLVISGEDMLYLSRTALNGAHNFHDANFQTFHRIKNFRSLI